MKTKLVSFVILMVFIILSCNKETLLDSTYSFKAIVIGKVNSQSINCSEDPYTLKFVNKLEDVRSLAYNGSGHDQDSTFTVINLPDELKTVGIPVTLDIRKPKLNELPGCYNFEMPVLLGSGIVYAIKAKMIDISKIKVIPEN